MVRRKAISPLLALAALCCGAAFALAVAGCGAGGPRVLAVEGRVTVGGKPLTSGTGTVIFYPDAARGNTSQEEPRGALDTEGRYRLRTGPRDGAAPGWYRVAVTAAKQLDPNNPYFTEWLIPQRYIDPKTSNLSVQVVEAPAPGTYDLKLDAK
jgi:hypothetical protein